MPTTIVMPQLGESVAEGVIGKWLKNEGDQIQKDEPIVEVITDKVNAEIPSPVGGVLQKISQPEGATVAVGQEIAVIGDDGGGLATSPSAPEEATPMATGDGPQAGAPAAPTASVAAGDGGRQAPSTAQATTPAAVAASTGQGRAERVRSSPLVRRLAEQHGIDLAEVPGTGLGGRVSKQDILAFVEQREKAAATAPHLQPADIFERDKRPAVQAPPRAPAAPPAPPAQPARQPGPNEELIPVSPLRKMIAERMVLSKSTIPHATTMAEVDMTSVVRFREARKDEFRAREGVPLSYVAFTIKATVEALKEFPMVNAEWAGENIILKKDININVAVDAPEGLITPVIHHADEMSLAGLSKAIYDLAARARNKQLKVEDMQGGTFTANNTGALGSISGVSIINYPQGGILATGAIVKRPVVLEQDGGDVIAVRSMMNLSFSFDHRLLDGGSAVSFVNAVKQKLESWSMDYPVY
jgi:2-oxoglutarate dehydrogenase dihydrolipoamide succinyltransferase (E2 component)